MQGRNPACGQCSQLMSERTVCPPSTYTTSYVEVAPADTDAARDSTESPFTAVTRSLFVALAILLRNRFCLTLVDNKLGMLSSVSVDVRRHRGGLISSPWIQIPLRKELNFFVSVNMRVSPLLVSVADLSRNLSRFSFEVLSHATT